MKNIIEKFYTEEQLAKLQGYQNAVYQSRNALFITAGVLMITQLITSARTYNSPRLTEMGLFASMFCTFIGLALYTNKKPFTSLAIGVLVYIGYVLIHTIPYILQEGYGGFLHGLYIGCIFKIIIITVISKPVPQAKMMQKLKDNFDDEKSTSKE